MALNTDIEKVNSSHVNSVPENGRVLSGIQVSPTSTEQRAFYIGEGKNLHALDSVSGSWTDLDLTQTTGHPVAAPQGGMVAWIYQSSPAVAYVDNLNDIGLFMLASEWEYTNLTNATGAPQAISGSSLVSYPTTLEGHSVFIGVDSNIWEILYDNGAWHADNLTSNAGALAPRTGSPMSAYTTDTDYQHVSFIATDGNVYQLFYSGVSWETLNLTELAGATQPPGNQGLTGYFTASTQAEHVNYIGTDFNIYELVRNSNETWKTYQLTQGGAVAPDSALVGFVSSYDGLEHILYVDGSGNTWDLYYSDGWKSRNLTSLSGAPASTSPQSLAGYSTQVDQTEHILFVSSGAVYEIRNSAGHWTVVQATEPAG